MTATYGGKVTDAAATPSPEPKRHPYLDASPTEVRAMLVPEEVPDFDRRWREVLTQAAETMDLTPVNEMLDAWRRQAWTTQALGHEGYRQMLAKAERILRTGKLPPGTVPWSQVKAELGL